MLSGVTPAPVYDVTPASNMVHISCSATAVTFDSDATIFGLLIGAGCEVNSDSVDDHPMLAICKVREPMVL